MRLPSTGRPSAPLTRLNRPGRAVVAGAARLLLEPGIGENESNGRKTGGEEGRPGEIGRGRIGAGEHAAQCRPHGEAEAEGGADHAHALGAALGRRHVGDISLRRRNVPCPRAGQEPRAEQHPQLPREAEPDIGQDRAGKAHQQHRAPADAIRDAPQDRRRDELRQRIGRHQHRHRESRGVVAQRVIRQQRDDHAEADEIDEDDEKEDGHAGVIDRTVRRRLRAAIRGPRARRRRRMLRPPPPTPLRAFSR